MTYSITLFCILLGANLVLTSSSTASENMEVEEQLPDLSPNKQGLVDLADKNLHMLPESAIQALATNSAIKKIDLTYNYLKIGTFQLLWQMLAQNGRTEAVAVSGKMNRDAVERAKEFGGDLNCYRWFIGPDPLQ